MSGAFFLVFSAFLHALWNAFVKKSSDAQTTLLGILLVAALTAVGCSFAIGVVSFSSQAAFCWSLAAGFFEAAYMIFLAKALRDSSLGVSYVIMRGGAMLVVWVISSIFLGEVFTGKTGLGVVTMIVGLIVTSEKTQNRGRLLWPVLCACFIAGYHLCYGQAMAPSALLEIGLLGEAPLVFAVAMVVAVPLFFLTVGVEGALKLKERLTTRPLPIIIGGLICGSSFILFLVGLTKAGAGYAITLRNTSILFAQVFALAIGEKVNLRQWLGATLVMIGASCLAL